MCKRTSDDRSKERGCVLRGISGGRYMKGPAILGKCGVEGYNVFPETKKGGACDRTEGKCLLGERSQLGSVGEFGKGSKGSNFS